MPKKDSDLFQARFKNVKQKIFIDEYIQITQAKIEGDLGIGHCSKALALFTLLKENAGNNGSMKGGKLIPEYYHQEWIDERLSEFEIARQGYALQLTMLNNVFSDIMKRENDNDDLLLWEAESTKERGLKVCFTYFKDKLIPRVKDFNEKYQDGE